MNKTLFEPATKRKYLYHITDIRNIESIKNKGLLPKKKSGKFGYMTPGLSKKRNKPILFLLPIFGIHSYGMKGFLSEWWHGDIKDIIFLRMSFDSVLNPLQSSNKYYSKQEVFTFSSIKAEDIYCLKWLVKPYKWNKICDFN